VQDWLPAPHLARYVVDVSEGLEPSALEHIYAGRGSEASPSGDAAVAVDLRYPMGTLSSGRIERATRDSLAFRFIACNQHPDHDTLACFRRRVGE
jgi:hypothetical protein